MTPFDPAALLAVLSAWYPTVSTSALAQARSEQPDVFAGGTLIGNGDRLQLGDGRVFLLIWNGAWTVTGDTNDPSAAGVWDGPRIAAYVQSLGLTPPASMVQQWLTYWAAWGWKDPGYFKYRLSHAQELVDAGLATPLPPDTGIDDGLTLDAGMLVPADAAAVVIPPAGAVFTPLVSEALAPLDGTDAQLDGVNETVQSFTGADQLAASGAGLDDAAQAHTDAQTALEGTDPGDLVATSDGHLAIIEQTQPDYVQDPPPDLPVPDPPPPPGKGDPGYTPPQF